MPASKSWANVTRSAWRMFCATSNTPSTAVTRSSPPKSATICDGAIRVGKRRSQLKNSTLAVYAAKADTKLDRLMMPPVAHPAGKLLLRQVKAWRTKFFVFMVDRDVPPTNNISEREIRPSVVFRKVTNGFRSDWGAQIHAGYRSVTGTARIAGQTALAAIRKLVDGKFAIA